MRRPNEQQRRVIDELEQNILLYASAGTGKTFTVANRVANILTSGRALPHEVLCLTFTIKAARELKEDILAYAGKEADGVNAFTIHSFCYRVLAEELARRGLGGAPTVCDEVDQEEILKEILSSRYAYWRMENAYLAQELPLPNFENAVPVLVGEDSFFRLGDDLISPHGKVYFGKAKEGKCLPVKVVCPRCGQETAGQVCGECGEKLLYRLENKDFLFYSKKSGLRNFISELKHIRERMGLFSASPQEDYEAAFSAFQEENPKAYENTFSYFARFEGRKVDEEFENAMREFAGRLAAEYDDYLSKSRLVDFDDIIFSAKAFLSEEETGALWREKYKYITVDEMQDTSRLEYSVLKNLFFGNKVMLCGDFFQTIYEWRGSCPNEILESYTQEFSPVVFALSENYRATRTLAEASYGYLKNAYKEALKKFFPDDLKIHSEEEGEPIFCYAFDNRLQEAHQIYRFLQRVEDPTKVCVMARTNRYVAELVSHFEKFTQNGEGDLRFFTAEEGFQFFKKPLVKDALAVLRLLVNPFETSSMERIAKKYIRSVGEKTLASLRELGEIGVSVCSFLDGQAYEYSDPYYRLAEGYSQGKIVVYDTETTGPDLERDEAIQIAAVKMGKAGILEELNLFIKPTVPLSQGAIDTHGFSLEYIEEHGVEAKEALERFREFAEGCVLVGHNNLAFDAPLIKRQFADNSVPAPCVLGEYDTLVLAKLFYAGLTNYKLATLCERFSVVNERAHDAFGDIVATGKCLGVMLEEKILPTALLRTDAILRYRERFEKFFLFFKEAKRRLKENDGVGQFIVDGLRLKNKYPTYSDGETIRDLLGGLAFEGDGEQFLRGYLRDASLSGSQMDLLFKGTGKIPVVTVHQSKGCEFDTVVVAGACNGQFPVFGVTESGEDEEKKVFYVALTRAKKKLVLTRALKNGRQPAEITPYFYLIPEEYIQTNRAWRENG